MSLTNYCVYTHKNKINDKVYIGVTQQNANRRWQKGAGYEGTHFGNAVKKYGWDAFTHEIIAEGLSREDAFEREKELIKEYKSTDPNFGYNVSVGGKTMYCAPKYGKDNPRSSAVRRINPTNGEIVRFETIKEASDSMNINHRGISKACRGISKTYKGYIWEYADKPYEKPAKYQRGKYPHQKQKKRVKLIEVNGEELIFESVGAAAEYAGVKGCTISRYIYGGRIDSSGRGWSLCL